jgi:hypothetical protein
MDTSHSRTRTRELGALCRTILHLHSPILTCKSMRAALAPLSQVRHHNHKIVDLMSNPNKREDLFHQAVLNRNLREWRRTATRRKSRPPIRTLPAQCPSTPPTRRNRETLGRLERLAPVCPACFVGERTPANLLQSTVEAYYSTVDAALMLSGLFIFDLG